LLSEASTKVWAKARHMAKSAGKGAAERLRAGYNFFSGALPLPLAGVGGFNMYMYIYMKQKLLYPYPSFSHHMYLAR